MQDNGVIGGPERPDEASHPTVDAGVSLERRILSGDRSAEEELAGRFHRPVFALILARTGDVEAARDLTQEALLCVIRQLRQGRLEKPDRLEAYVRGTARNLANNHLRTQARRRSARPPEVSRVLPGPDVDLEIRERLEQVGRALQELPSRDRQILLGTLLDGQRPGEIASRLGMKPEAIRQRKSRALRRIREAVRRVSRNAAAGHTVAEGDL